MNLALANQQVADRRCLITIQHAHAENSNMSFVVCTIVVQSVYQMMKTQPSNQQQCELSLYPGSLPVELPVEVPVELLVEGALTAVELPA